MTQRISDRGVRAKSNSLDGKRIALGICGGIAAVETVRLARELRRHGARVFPFVTPSATDFVGALSVEWACGEKPVEKVGAEVDHLVEFDLVLVAPATLNTIAKCALGLTDNAVTLLVAGQLGRRAPLYFVPTMNVQLAEHPLYPAYKRTLEGWGARFHASAVEEDRLKMPDPVGLADTIISFMGAA